MRNLKVVASMFLLGLLMSVSLPSVKADSGNWDTFLTFSNPVEVGGLALVPGRYEFRLLDSTGPANVVAILNSKGDFLEAVQGIPVYRTETTGKTVVKFEKRGPNTPEALQEWFYPGQNYGVEFNYKTTKTPEPIQAGK
jgi:hypothetical protein